MADYAISNVPRRVVYANSGVGPYAFTFEILSQTDISVYRGSTLLTLTTDYSVTINTNGTGSVTLVTAGTGNITIVGAKNIQRTTDFTTGGDLFANSLNDELDNQTIFVQQVAETAERGLKAPVTDPTDIAMTLPAKASRAGKTLAFDANGNPVVGEDIGNWRGNWAAGTSYTVRDLVKDASNYNVYRCNTAHTASGTTPVSSNADSAKWDLVIDADYAKQQADAAAASATAAQTAETNAETAETNAETAETNAEAAQAAAELAALNAANSETAAALAESATSTLHDAVVALYDSFDDRYLGSKSSNPTVDNDGNTLLDGALYWNTTANEFRVYDLGTTTWSKTVPSSAEQTNINTVSTNIANVNTVAGISANVTTVAGISGNVTSVAGNATNINTVAGISSNVTTVAGISGNVTTVAGISGNVTSVAGNASNINQVASDTVAINAASANAATATTKAAEALASANSASASAAAASAVALGNEPVRHSVRPSLLLDFANTKTLDPRITFTRGSTATFYDGRTVAKAEENLFERSQEFDNVYWNKNNSSITANSTTAPDGTTTADSLVEDSANNIHYLQRGGAFTTTSGQVYAFSVYAKANTRTWLYMEIYDGANYQAYFNLSTGVTGTVSGGIAATITSVGNGWYRCSIVRTVSTGAISPNFGLASADNTRSYLGNGASSIFIWGAQLEQRSSVTAYTPTTTAPITNYIPALQTAGNNVPRFEHNPVTGDSLGLEIEEQRTNLCLRSEELDNASWSKNGITVSANATIAPDGTLTADKIIGTATTAFHLIQATAVTGSGSHTMSVYAKAGEYIRFAIRESNVTGHGVLFDLSTGTIVATNGGAVGTITPVGNGWYRCTATITWGTNYSLGLTLSTATNPGDMLQSFTGNGFSGIYVWGAAIEAGSFATSYIPTVASQVTRSADSASMTGTNFSSWYRADEGSFFANAISNAATGGSNRILWVRNTATSSYDDAIALDIRRNQNLILAEIRVNNVAQAQPSFVLNSSGGQLALAYKTNDFALSFNGLGASTDTTGRVPTVNAMNIGSHIDGTNLNGSIKKIAYYPARLTNAELQGLTTV